LFFNGLGDFFDFYAFDSNFGAFFILSVEDWSCGSDS
jgi:hypothetical protein